MEPLGNSENLLVLAARQGDLDSFNELVLQYQDLVYHQALSILKNPAAAEDIAQDSFLQAYRNLDKFRGGSFRAWLLRITTNACLDELRRWENRSIFSASLNAQDDPAASPEESWADLSPSVEELVEQGELSGLLQHSLAELGEEYRTVVTLVDVFGFDYTEAAQTLGIPVGTVKSRLARARMRLKERLQNCTHFFTDTVPSLTIAYSS